MDLDMLRSLLEQVSAGKVSAPDALESLRSLPFAQIEDARVDHHRTVRCGFPEVIFCQGKSADQVRSIGRELLEHSEVLLATRADSAQHQALARVAPDARYYERARLIVVDRRKSRPAEGHIVVATGGTADIPVAEEAAITAELMGNRVTRLYDVGVAGVHRLLAQQSTLRSARVIVAIAGMEGALPSLVAGLVSCPVIAVPTSIGYGASFGGIAPLLTMLNSCASGISVVNIDNGFGAATVASKINRPCEPGPIPDEKSAPAPADSGAQPAGEAER